MPEPIPEPDSTGDEKKKQPYINHRKTGERE
jgi:hypothetical protein